MNTHSKTPLRAEEILHQQAAAYLALALPANAVFHHSPNEGIRALAFKAKLARMGTKSGWPDFEIIFTGRVYFLELKSPSGRLSGNQETLHPQLAAAGALVAVCRSLDEVESALRSWGIPLCATQGGWEGIRPL